MVAEISAGGFSCRSVSNSSRARASSVFPEQEIAAGQLQARGHVVGEIEQVTFEGEHAVAGVAGVDRRDTEEEIEGGIAELFGMFFRLGVRVGCLALFDQGLQIVRRRSVRRQRQHAGDARAQAS